SYIHPARIMLDGCTQKLFDFRERHDFIKLLLDLALAHAKDGATKVDVFGSGQFGVEAGTNFEKASNASIDFRGTSGRLCDARKDFQEGRFPCAIAANQPDHLATANFQRSVSQRPDVGAVSIVIAVSMISIGRRQVALREGTHGR